MKKSTLLTVGTVTALGLVLADNYLIDISEYTVKSDKIPSGFDGFKILQLSDFHCKSFGFDNLYLVAKIKEIAPDIILMTGDMVSREDRSFYYFYHLAKAIGKTYDVYYTIGNHELDLKEEELNEMYAMLKGYGVKILNNEKTTLSRNGSSIDLYGMWYGLKYYKDMHGNYRNHENFNGQELLRILGKRSQENYSILMAHNPLVFPIYAEWGADLTFSGHVHGGVVRLGALGGLLSPGRQFFPKYYAGEYEIGEKKMIVSRGIGGIRLFNKPNLVVCTLKSE